MMCILPLLCWEVCLDEHVLNIFRSDYAVTVIGQQIHWQVHNSVFVYLTFESDKKKRSSHKYILNVKLSK